MPRQAQRRHAETVVVHAAVHFRRAEPEIAKARLVGEESRQRVAEVFLIMFVMRLVDGLQQDGDGFRVHHVDVILLARIHARAGFVEEKDPPAAFRNVPYQLSVDDIVRQWNRLGLKRFL